MSEQHSVPQECPQLRVAQLLWGIDPPPSLIDNLHDINLSLSTCYTMYQAQPTRKAMKLRIARLKIRTSALISALTDSATMDFLEAAGKVEIQNRGDLVNSLETVVIALNAAMIPANLPAKAGPGRPLPDAILPPKLFCAIMIVEAWRDIHGKYPGPRNDKATKAAQIFWEAATADTRPSKGKAPSWRRHFNKAKRIANAKYKTLSMEMHLISETPRLYHS